MSLNSIISALVGVGSFGTPALANYNGNGGMLDLGVAPGGTATGSTSTYTQFNSTVSTTQTFDIGAYHGFSTHSEQFSGWMDNWAGQFGQGSASDIIDNTNDYALAFGPDLNYRAYDSSYDEQYLSDSWSPTGVSHTDSDNGWLNDYSHMEAFGLSTTTMDDESWNAYHYSSAYLLGGGKG